MKIEYCGGWGYGGKVKAAMMQIDKLRPNMFSYFTYQDAGSTGRFELTIYKDSKNDLGQG